MPLNHGYGVVIGTVANHRIESPDSEGRWPHYIINVNTPSGLYECVINLKSRTEIKIEYKDFRNQDLCWFSNILDLPDGYNNLESISGSGALDHIRHPGLKNRALRYKWFWFTRRYRCKCTQWWKENGTNLIQLMEFYLTRVERIYIFGEPYDTELGIHNIHMNQGDPIGSGFDLENGIWQDGGVILQYFTPQPRLSVFLTKFETQSYSTDSNGHPV